MPFVVSLSDFLPPARFDSVPWSTATIYESAISTGPWVLIDTKALAPLDANPAQPQPRNFTTSLATLANGWYRVVFFDGAGGQSDASAAVHNIEGLDLPVTAGMVRDASPLLRAQFPAPSSDAFASADLTNLVTQSVAYVQSMTWRILDPALGCAAPDDYVCELTPPALVPVAIMAIARVAERLRITTNAEFAQQLASGRLLRGFSAGPYSESYFAPGEFSRRGVIGRPPMDPDTHIDAALWALATEDARDYFVFRASGVAPPTGVATAFDYRRQSTGYGHSGGRGWGAPLDLGHGGPDGF